MTTTPIRLTYPVTVDGQEYTVLQMRRAKVKDRRMAMKQADDASREVHLIANLCEVPPHVIDELDAADYAKLTETLQGFFASATST
jgi:hypothetical protein